MKGFLRLLKAIGMTLVICVVATMGFFLMAWTKGLFALILVFVFLVTACDSWLKFREATMRKGDRKWGI